MLYLPSDFATRVTRLPHRGDFDTWTARLSAAEIQAIEDELNRLIDDGLTRGQEVQVAGWMPGADWSGTVWDPIYTKAASRSVGAAALCFGLFVWKVMMERPEDWSFVSDATNPDGSPIRSKVYFRIHRP